ncbi:MAG: universal stress protein [Chloroflexota bacterium]|nr:universal stress protein [Chloroflexota bacterium]
MFRHLLAAVDGSEPSLQAARTAMELAAQVGAELDLVSVAEEPPAYRTERHELEAELAASQAYFRRLHAQADGEAQRQGIAFTARILTGHEVQSVIQYARERAIDLLVVGARGHSTVWEAFLGSTADKLVGHAPTSVLAIRPQAAGRGFKEIVVGLDGSPLSERAFQAALELSRSRGGALRGISVIEDAPSRSKASANTEATYLRDVQIRAAAAAESAGVNLELVMREGHAAQAITSYADEVDADLIVIGSTGQQLPWSLTAGGTARRVANEARQAVLLVRPIEPERVSDVMVRYVTTVRPGTPLPEIVDLLVRRRIKALPVLDEQERVVGIITGGDLLERARLGLRLPLHTSLEADELAAISERAEAVTSARNIMTPQPRTVSPTASLEEAIHELVSSNVKRLPVINQGRLVGMVSRTDILRAVAAVPSTAASEARPAGAAHSVADVMNRTVPTVTPEAPAENVLEALLRSPYRRIVVIDADRHVQGIISDRRLLAHADARSRPSLLARLAGLAGVGRPAEHLPLTAARLMEGVVYTISPEASLEEAARELTARRVKRLVVVDEDKRLLGMLDRRALLESLATGSRGV